MYNNDKIAISCNKCGKLISNNKETIKADYIYVKKSWGYFSNKDSLTTEFRMCENCYDDLIKEFVIPVCTKKTTELL